MERTPLQPVWLLARLFYHRTTSTRAGQKRTALSAPAVRHMQSTAISAPPPPPGHVASGDGDGDGDGGETR